MDQKDGIWMNHFILDGRYEDLLSHYKFNVEEALKKANIPEDCFKKLHPSMSEQQYYNFIAAIGDQISDPFTPIEIATTNPIESFSPPIFAAYSSRNGDIFIKRLAKYKKLIGPLSFKIDEDSKQLSITLTPSNQQYSLPSFLVLSELSVDDSTSARVRSILTELLPNGEFTIDDVAKKLGYSKQTLQRKLSSENTTFQKQLNSTREVLALNYLQNTDMTTSDIAYLLGYQEFNSFLRAFSIWKGMSISEYREKMNK